MVVTPVIGAGATCLMRELPWVLMLLCKVLCTAVGVLDSVICQTQAMPAHFVDVQMLFEQNALKQLGPW